MLTDYHLHLRPDEDETTFERYFTAANAERYRAAADAAGIEELGVSEHVYRFRQALDLWSHPLWLENAADDLDAYCEFVRSTSLRLGVECDFVPGAEDIERPQPVRGNAQPGADRLQCRGALADGHLPPGLLQARRGRQAADPGADDHRARGRSRRAQPLARHCLPDRSGDVLGENFSRAVANGRIPASPERRPARRHPIRRQRRRSAQMVQLTG